MDDTFSVDNECISRTMKCSKDYACLSGEGECLCTVLDVIGSDVIFVNPLHPYCTYMIRFGYSSICHCPTRREIYRRYRR